VLGAAAVFGMMFAVYWSNRFISADSGTGATLTFEGTPTTGTLAIGPPESKAMIDPVAAIEMKVAQQQLEKTLTDIEEARAEAESLSSQFSADHPKVKESHVKMRALEDKAARHREVIQKNREPYADTEAMLDPAAAAELKVAEQQWEKILTKISETESERSALSAKLGASDPKVKELDGKVQLLIEEARGPLDIIQKIKAPLSLNVSVAIKAAREELQARLRANEAIKDELARLESRPQPDPVASARMAERLKAGLQASELGIAELRALLYPTIPPQQPALSLTTSGIAINTATATASADLSKANLAGADLSKVDLSKADLSKADLSRADLSHAVPGAAYNFIKSVGGWLYMAGVAFAFYIARRRTGLSGFGWLLIFALGALALALVKFFVMRWLAYAFSPQAVAYAAVAAEVLDFLLYGCAIVGSFTLVLGFRRRQQSQSTQPTKQP
jgi:hypothetical protein